MLMEQGKSEQISPGFHGGAHGSNTQHVILGRNSFIFPNVDMQY